MGNRAVITFDKEPTPQSLGVYLHWNGGAESVLAFASALDEFKCRDNNDEPYQLARFIQIVANFFGGTTSVGVDRLENLDCDNGDNGVFRVQRNAGKLTIDRSPDGKLAETCFSPLDLDEVRKHPYWQKDNASQTILDKVIERNKEHFKAE